MDIQLIILGIGFTTIIVSFVWARIKLFESSAKSSILAFLVYDCVVAIHIFYSFYGLANSSSISTFTFISAAACLLLGGSLFAWTANMSGSKKLVFNNDIDRLKTDGPYGLVRHPFYLSYALTWGAMTLSTDLPIQWITLVYLLAFYFLSARREEKALLRSAYSEEYGKYRSEVGMFFPRIIRWIN